MTFSIDAKTQPSTAQDEVPKDAEQAGGGIDWLRRARSAYRTSTTYVDANYRKSWDDSIRAFNNQHPGDSKYASPAYDKRSKLYRPKIRAVMRKNEAAAAAAFFSNMDVVSLSATDQTDKAQLVSAEVMKMILQYRLTKTIPWFQLVLGALQDAQTIGACVAHVYWQFKQSSEGAVKVDKPCIDLVPIENIRFDPSASWIDPVNTSPYFIHLLPMYAMDVREKMESGEWFELPLSTATAGQDDSTRSARASNKEDPMGGSSRALEDHEIVWVQRHIHRMGDDGDVEFYTLSDVGLLTDPQPLTNSVFHGRRPFVMGNCILETHKAIPSGIPTLARGLADETNEIANQRIDNVKFALNKKWFAKRGVEVDIAGLVRNVPGGVVMMNDPINDVREITWPDVTQSAYMEQQSNDLSMDELLGNFNPAALMTAGAGNAPARNMAMLSQSNGTLVEYTIRTFVETWVQPVLRQLILLEQHYETDQVVLGIAAKNSKLLQKFGIDEVTDELLMQEVTLMVSVGMGATDPTQKLSKFLSAFSAYTAAMKNPTPGVNMVEVGKEIFGHLGYQDGSRFFTVEDPQVAALQQQLQQAMQVIQQLQAKINEKNTAHMVGIQKTRETNQTKLQIATIQEENENKRSLATHYAALHMHGKEKSSDKR